MSLLPLFFVTRFWLQEPGNSDTRFLMLDVITLLFIFFFAPTHRKYRLASFEDAIAP